MRLLGIDYGTKRVGTALSDQTGTFAYPYQVLFNDRQLVSKIKAICLKEKVSKIILGESCHFTGKANPLMRRILVFQKRLVQELALPVDFELEFLTSVEAERLQGRNEMLDASAAAVILRNYLERSSRRLLSGVTTTAPEAIY